MGKCLPLCSLRSLHLPFRSLRSLRFASPSPCNNILKRFGMEDCKAVSSPVDMSSRLVSSDAATKVDAPFREAVGALMHLTTATHPDIAYAVGYVSRFMENPQEDHWIAVKRILRYLQGTKRMESTTSRVTRSTFVDIRMQTGPVTSPTASRLRATCSCYWVHQ